MDRTAPDQQQDTPTPPREATALDVIERLATSPHQWTEVPALGTPTAIAAAEAAGLIRTTTHHGTQLAQLTSTVLSATRVATALIVVTDQPDSYACRYAVDTWALPTDAETDPELADWARRPAGQPYLIDQGGDDGPDGVARMVAEAEAYLASIGIHAEKAQVAR